MRRTAFLLFALVALTSARHKWAPSGSQSGGGQTYVPSQTGGYGGNDNGYGASQTKYHASSATGPTTTDLSDYHGSGGTGSGNGNGGNSGSGNGLPTETGALEPSPTGLSGGNSTNATLSNGKISLPAGCESLNAIGIGWLPDVGNDVSLTTITSALGNVKPCFAGYYAQISSSTWDGSQLTEKINEVKAGGAPYPIFVASVMPTIGFSKIPAMADQITKVMNTLTDAGLTVWLRYAHEMNWYNSAAAGYTYPEDSLSDFYASWAAVSQAVASNPNVFMCWSPNSASSASLKSWYPTSGTVDVIGIDIYPKSDQSFQSVYGDFCNAWPNIPFAIGETGAGDAESKTYWLQQLTSKDAKTACPNYVGWSWFEYNKDGTDFRVATGGNNEAQQVLGT